jgi:iron complex transport system substrate-binding protein
MRVFLCLVTFLLLSANVGHSSMTHIDAMGRAITLPNTIERLICSGPGCLRLITYLQATDLVVAVDDMETRRSKFDARPYILAHPELKKLPTFGKFRGHDSPELIVSLAPAPQVIFKTYAGIMGYDPVELQDKTGIPVVALNYGNLANKRPDFYASLRLLGQILGREKRAEAVIKFFEESIADLQTRSQKHPGQAPSVFLGGVAFKGPHGCQATEPTYPPFMFLGANNLAAQPGFTGPQLHHTEVSKEQIVSWDPSILFLDLATMQMGPEVNGLFELRHDPAYQTLRAIRQGEVYGVLPYNWYSINYGSILANSYYLGTILQPQGFADIDPGQQAEAIYSFLVGKPVFGQMNTLFKGMAYQRLVVQ